MLCQIIKQIFYNKQHRIVKTPTKQNKNLTEKE